MEREGGGSGERRRKPCNLLPSVFPQVVVVGNPANTNAMICSRFAPSIPKKNFTCLTRLDQNRAQAQVRKREKKGGENGEGEESMYLLTMFCMFTLRLLLASA